MRTNDAREQTTQHTVNSKDIEEAQRKHYVSNQQKIRKAADCTVQSGYLNRPSFTAPFVLFALSASAFILSMKWAPFYILPGFSFSLTFSLALSRIFRGKWSAYTLQNRLSHRKTLMWQQRKRNTHAHTNMINVFSFFLLRWEMNRFVVL